MNRLSKYILFEKSEEEVDFFTKHYNENLK